MTRSDSSDDPEDPRDDSPTADRRRSRPRTEAARRRASESRAQGERSPEWPFAPAEEEAERRSPERGPERSRERPPKWGLQARPDVDVAEHPEEVHVWCDLPGCGEDTIELSGDEWTLYVSAERSEEYWEEGGIQRRERSQRAERSISLPARSEVDEAEAEFEDGVLFVRAPKHESAHPRAIGFE